MILVHISSKMQANFKREPTGALAFLGIYIDIGIGYLPSKLERGVVGTTT